MARLSAEQRKKLPASAFVFSSERRYPIPDARHAEQAIRMVIAHGSASQKRKVFAAVKRKFPAVARKFEKAMEK